MNGEGRRKIKRIIVLENVVKFLGMRVNGLNGFFVIGVWINL